MNSRLVCEKCGEDNVLQMKWINPNNSLIGKDPEGLVVEGCADFCEICNSQTTIIEQSAYSPSTEFRLSKLWEESYKKYENREMDGSDRYDLIDEICADLEDVDEDTVADFVDKHIKYMEF